MPVAIVAVMLGFQLKHLIADYFLQFDWMVAQKGDLRKPGGYAHAGMHVLGSAIVLFLARTSIVTVVALLAAEFVVHYALDFGKIYYSRDVSMHDSPQKYFALHGLDQFFHHLTYLVMTYVVVVAYAA